MITQALWTFSRAAGVVLRPPKLSPRENTKRCYETLFDPLFAVTGVWPDYTEGHYPDGDETYEEAKLKQFDFILDQCEVGPGTRMLDIGCGNGRLVERAKERGAEVTGITISEVQQKNCAARGLDVRLMSFDEAARNFAADEFDAVVLNGSTEHFVTELDALNGRDEQIRTELLEAVRYLLAPKGRVFITCIHFRDPTDLDDLKRAMQAPTDLPIKSRDFYHSVLIKIYSGWYPNDGDYQAIAEKLGFRVLLERDATHDYYVTSLNWGKLMDAFVKKNRFFVGKFFWKYFLRDPIYSFYTYLYWWHRAWIWQFTPGEDSPAPMVHRWLMFEGPGASAAPA